MDMELKLQNLFTNLGSLGQFDSNGGDVSGGLEAFLDSSDSFTFIIGGGLNLYDHEGNRFRRVMGTFGVDETPPATIFVDDVKIVEGSVDKNASFAVSLSKAQPSDVTFDFSISSSSTASSDDYLG